MLGLQFVEVLDVRDEVKAQIKTSLDDALRLNETTVALIKKGQEVDLDRLPPLEDSFHAVFASAATAAERRYLNSAHVSLQWFAFRTLARLRAAAEFYGPAASDHPAHRVLAEMRKMLPSLPKQRLPKEETPEARAAVRKKYDEFLSTLATTNDIVAREMMSRLSFEVELLANDKRD